MSNSKPIVSTIIPTRNRPELVVRAVRTALEQTFRELEVLVVIDGADNSTAISLGVINDCRLRIIELARTVGGSDARNIGVREARGEWIAFLDDDDEWLPEKIARQMAACSGSRYAFPIVTTQLIAREPHAEMIWPRRAPESPISDYLFTRRSWTYGDGVIQSSTILASRALLMEVPFSSGLRKHQDWDWILRAVGRSGVGIEFVRQPLAIWNRPNSKSRVSKMADWQFSLNWIRKNRHLVTARAFSGFLMTHCAAQASLQRNWSAFWILLRESCRHGSPEPFDFLLYLAAWATPELFKGRLTALLNR